jgi:hypothetical protein
MSTKHQRPSTEDLYERLDQLKQQRTKMDESIGRLEYKILRRSIQEERELYFPESRGFLEYRVPLGEMWEEFDVKEVYADFERCAFHADDCWYQGNMDRLDGLGLYRLRGYDSLLLCDACFENGRHRDNPDTVICEARPHIRTADERLGYNSLAYKLAPAELDEEGPEWPKTKDEIKCAFGPGCAYQRPYAQLQWLGEMYQAGDGRRVCDECAKTHSSLPENP